MAEPDAGEIAREIVGRHWPREVTRYDEQWKQTTAVAIAAAIQSQVAEALERAAQVADRWNGREVALAASVNRLRKARIAAAVAEGIADHIRALIPTLAKIEPSRFPQETESLSGKSEDG